jgi:hypothetical protein
MFVSYLVTEETIFECSILFESTFIYSVNMGVQLFYGKWPLPLLWADLRAARGRITRSGARSCLNYCTIVMVYIQFTDTAADRMTQPDGSRTVRLPRVGDPWC